jgi:hypothetical protein
MATLAEVIADLQAEVAKFDTVASAAAGLLRLRDMGTIQCQVINQTTVLSDGDAVKVVPALQTQWTRDLAPAWGLGHAQFSFVPKGGKPAADTWWGPLVDDPDVAGALGYHDLTSSGLPIWKVFAKLDLQNNLSWTVTASHEMCETGVDPRINAAKQAGGTFWAAEICDAVESDADGSEIDGVKVSNLVLPAYFEPGSPGPWDLQKLLTGPLTLRPGGYMSYLELANNQGWTQVNAETGTQRHPELLAGSRQDRRIRHEALGRGARALPWRRSTVVTS